MWIFTICLLMQIGVNVFWVKDWDPFRSPVCEYCYTRVRCIAPLSQEELFAARRGVLVRWLLPEQRLERRLLCAPVQAHQSDAQGSGSQKRFLSAKCGDAVYLWSVG